MTKQKFPALGETLVRTVLPNGLTVLVAPRPGFSRKIAYFATDFGSIHTDFTLSGREIHAPAGIAHFLEHKMFDLPGGRDISAELSQLGASVNAFTSYDMTAYYFSCTDGFDESLRLLLEFVSTPCFTAEGIQKELGIIDQEIGMNLDSPDTCAFQNLVSALYREHPIRVPILGTNASIREITPELLRDCHRAFYTPANMVLCVVGDVDPESVARTAEAVLGGETREAGKKLWPWHEEMTADADAPVQAMDLPMPTFQLGFKCESEDSGEEAVRQEIVGDLAAEALFGESSQLYLELYEQGLIDSSFGGGFESVDGMAMLLCSGDSDDPEAVREAVLRRAEEIVRDGISDEAFLRMKRSALGRRIRDLDSFDATCFRLCAYHFMNFDYFRFPEIYQKIGKEEIRQFLGHAVQRARGCLSVVVPNEEVS